MRTLVVLFVWLGLAGAATAEDAGVRAFHDRFFAAWNTGDISGLEASLTADTIYHPMNTTTMIGRDAVMASYRKLLAENAVQMRVTPEVLEADGDRGLMIGIYTAVLTPKAGSPPVSRSGRYLMELKKDGGAWRISRELTQPTADTSATSTP